MIGDEMTLNQVRARLATTLDRWESGCDRRALFLMLYSLATDGVHDAVCRDTFSDPLWVLRVVSHLADHYFITVVPDDDDRTHVTPAAWHAAHQAARGDDGTSSSVALMLGVNAHLSNDLPQAIAITLRQDWPLQSRTLQARRQDLSVLSGLIGEATSCAVEAVHRWDARLSEQVRTVIDAWCDDAWTVALELATTDSVAWWTAVCEEIECTALRRAHLVACDIPGASRLVALPAAMLHQEFPALHGAGCALGVPVPSWGTPSQATSADR